MSDWSSARRMEVDALMKKEKERNTKRKGKERKGRADEEKAGAEGMARRTTLFILVYFRERSELGSPKNAESQGRTHVARDCSMRRVSMSVADGGDMRPPVVQNMVTERLAPPVQSPACVERFAPAPCLIDDGLTMIDNGAAIHMCVFRSIQRFRRSSLRGLRYS